MKRVIVLGCGPAGLIAANAASLAGADVRILSKPRKSHMNGAQYLHQPVPGILAGDPFQISYTLIGPPEGYRYKVYGRTWDGTVSPEDLETSHMAWDIRKTYDTLWSIFGRNVIDWSATPGGLKGMIGRYQPDLVVSTIPAPLLCADGHQFRSARIWSTDKAMTHLARNQVVCDGTDGRGWYRASNIQGFENTEWPDGSKPPVTPMWEVMKPLSNNCTCFPDVLRGGRYGKWTKGVLSHEIGPEVRAALCPCTPESPAHEHLAGGYAL